MQEGSVCDRSVWVMMQPVDSSTHVINRSLQVTQNGNTSYPGVSIYPGITMPHNGAWLQVNVVNYRMARW